jgi:Spy/CpxP family protein refolding chaperone
MINMNKLTTTIAIFMAVTATSVFAHHPSEEMNPNFDLVDAQLDAVDSPHLDMTFDDMGSTDMGDTSASGGNDVGNADQTQAGWTAGSDQSQAGTMYRDQPQTGPGPAAAAGTIDLMENVGQ